jgi:hypothetical protein
MHPKPIIKGLVHIWEHPLVLRQATGTWTHLTHHDPDSGEATTFPHIVFSTALRQSYIRMAFFSWDSQGKVPKLSPVGLLGIWASITSCSNLWLKWGLKQSYTFPQEFFYAKLHTICTHRDQVDSRLLVVGSQIASLTPDPSFAHNLGCRCPNDSCEAILDIYTSRISNDIKNTAIQGVLTLAIELWVFKSPGGLQLPTFGSVSFILTLNPKWGCDRWGLKQSCSPFLELSNSMSHVTCMQWIESIFDF